MKIFSLIILLIIVLISGCTESMFEDSTSLYNNYIEEFNELDNGFKEINETLEKGIYNFISDDYVKSRVYFELAKEMNDNLINQTNDIKEDVDKNYENGLLSEDDYAELKKNVDGYKCFFERYSQSITYLGLASKEAKDENYAEAYKNIDLANEYGFTINDCFDNNDNDLESDSGDINKTSHFIKESDGYFISYYYAGGDDDWLYLENNPDANDPTFDYLVYFIRKDKTDLLKRNNSFWDSDKAEILHNNAEANGIKSALVIVKYFGFEEWEWEWDAYNAFYTTDKGLIFIDCTSYSPPDKFNGNLDLLITVEEYEPIQWSFLYEDSQNEKWSITSRSGTVEKIEIFW